MVHAPCRNACFMLLIVMYMERYKWMLVAVHLDGLFACKCVACMRIGFYVNKFYLYAVSKGIHHCVCIANSYPLLYCVPDNHFLFCRTCIRIPKSNSLPSHFTDSIHCVFFA